MSSKEKMDACLCGTKPVLENIISLKFGFFGKGPMTVYRVVCPRCGEGRFKIQGDTTREKAIKDWNDSIRITREVMEEMKITWEDMKSDEKRTLIG